MLSVTPRIQIPREEFEFTFTRSSGPGGQNVNKVNSKATLRWRPGASASLPIDVLARFVAKYRPRMTTEHEILITSQRYRDQAKNIDDCLDKLRELLLAVAEPPKLRKKTRVSKAAKARRVADKRRESTKKQHRSLRGHMD